MTSPTPLSPAAQAVLDAANNVNSYGPDDCLNESRQIAAAALRAAANQMAAWADEDGRIELGDILAIAAELEAQ